MSGALSAYNVPMPFSPRHRTTLLRGALLLAFSAGMGTPALGRESELRLEYSSPLPTSDVKALQSLAADSWIGTIYVSFPEALRAKLGIVSTENLEHGVSLRLEISGTEAEQREIQALALEQVKALAAEASLPAAYRLSESSPDPHAGVKPAMPVKQARLWGVGSALALLLSFLAWRFGRRRFLTLPSFCGIPVVGMLPKGFGMGGRFLELQTPPGHAVGVFFRRMASKLKPGLREITVYSRTDLSASSVVTATLAVALLRERGRVLVVDLAGEDSPLPAILEETDDTGELPGAGSLRSTAISDLDLLTGLRPLANRRPPLPTELLGAYRWILYHAPIATPLAHSRHLLVVSGKTGWRDVWGGLLGAWWSKARIMGVVLAGADVPARMRAAYMARFYFEKLQGKEVSA